MSKPNGSGTENINFTYDAKGRRIAKERETTGSVDGDSYRYAFTAEYTYLDDALTDMKWIEIDGSDSSFYFTYDATGPMSMTFYGTEYFYLKNAQSDVVGLVDSSGTQVVAYTYDAWGNILSTTGSMADSLGYTNPFRYRGYFYDTETGLYYLGSRYYNPQWGRFINADAETLPTASPQNATTDKNLFAYCDNNPVVRRDAGGEYWLAIATGAVVGAGSDFLLQVLELKHNGLSGQDLWKELNIGSIVASGVSGGLSAIPGGSKLASAADMFLTPVIEESVNAAIKHEKISGKNILVGIATNVAADSITRKIPLTTPKYIRDVKKSIPKGSKKWRGTKKLTKYLRIVQVRKSAIIAATGTAYSHLASTRRR